MPRLFRIAFHLGSSHELQDNGVVGGVGGWLMVDGWWLVGGWWLLVAGWWLVSGGPGWLAVAGGGGRWLVGGGWWVVGNCMMETPQPWPPECVSLWHGVIVEGYKPGAI